MTRAQLTLLAVFAAGAMSLTIPAPVEAGSRHYSGSSYSGAGKYSNRHYRKSRRHRSRSYRIRRFGAARRYSSRRYGYGYGSRSYRYSRPYYFSSLGGYGPSGAYCY